MRTKSPRSKLTFSERLNADTIWIVTFFVLGVAVLDPWICDDKSRLIPLFLSWTLYLITSRRPLVLRSCFSFGALVC